MIKKDLSNKPKLQIGCLKIGGFVWSKQCLHFLKWLPTFKSLVPSHQNLDFWVAWKIRSSNFSLKGKKFELVLLLFVYIYILGCCIEFHLPKHLMYNMPVRWRLQACYTLRLKRKYTKVDFGNNYVGSSVSCCLKNKPLFSYPSFI